MFVEKHILIWYKSYKDLLNQTLQFFQNKDFKCNLKIYNFYGKLFYLEKYRIKIKTDN